LFIAEGDLGPRNRKLQQANANQKLPTQSMAFTSAREEEILDVAYVRLVLPFSSVIVLFVEDFSTIKYISATFDRWHKLNALANLVHELRPQLILVSATEGSKFSRLAVGRLQEHCEELKLFASVTVSFLASQDPAPHASHRSLKEGIVSQAERTSDARRRRFHLLSALHISTLYRASLLGAVRSPATQLDWLDVARRYIDNSRFCGNLTDVLLMTRAHGTPEDDISAFVASSMLLDAYPPGSHCKSAALATGLV